jgi:polysaccharide export outer membrane protein
MLVCFFFRAANVRLAWLVLFAAGCCTPRHEATTSTAKVPPADPVAPIAADYAVVFPDILEIHVEHCPDFPARAQVNPDGRIDLGTYGEVFAEGCTVADVRQRIAVAGHVAVEDVHCQVAIACSRNIHILGPGISRPRAVHYTGREQVAELLHRAGGLPPDADPTKIYVVRRNVARGKPSEIFPVDLTAIRHGDQRTNIVLEPNDEIHVAEGHSVMLASFLPDVRLP